MLYLGSYLGQLSLRNLVRIINELKLISSF